MQNRLNRAKRARKTRLKIAETGKSRLTIHRTPRHIYATIVSADSSETIAAANTLQADVIGSLDYSGNTAAAAAVGKAIAERALGKDVTEVAFDRSGFKYHGRVKALAEAARENGLKF